MEKFDELAGAVFHHCRNQLANDDDESYPIAEQQQKRKLEQQMSNRCACLCLYTRLAVWLSANALVAIDKLLNAGRL